MPSRVRVCLAVPAALLAAAIASAQGYDQQLRVLADTLDQKIATSGKKNVAVVDFTDLPGNTTELGRFLAEELSVDLAMVAKGYRVIDRTHLKAILQENKLASTGVIDTLTARKLGQIAGVDSLITGTVTPFGDSVRLTVKVLDTETAEMLVASSTDIPKTKAVEELLARGIGGGTASLGQTPQPAMKTDATGQALPTVTAQRGEVTFAARDCRRNGSQVFCVITVTNTGSRGTDLNLCGGYMLDNQGMRSQRVQWNFGGSEQCGGTLEPGLPVTLRMTTDDLSAGARSVSLVFENYPTTTILRNIPIQ